MEVNAVNENGFTALDIIEHTPRDMKGMEIREWSFKFQKQACSHGRKRYNNGD